VSVPDVLREIIARRRQEWTINGLRVTLMNDSAFHWRRLLEPGRCRLVLANNDQSSPL
jgi:hypothetical protein